jgi:hypothetical protein
MKDDPNPEIFENKKVEIVNKNKEEIEKTM